MWATQTYMCTHTETHADTEVLKFVGTHSQKNKVCTISYEITWTDEGDWHPLLFTLYLIESDLALDLVFQHNIVNNKWRWNGQKWWDPQPNI